MIKILFLALFALGANAGYSGGFSGSLSTGNLNAGLSSQLLSSQANTGSYGAGLNTYSAPVVNSYAAPQQQSYGPLEAAIQTRRTFELRNVPQQFDAPQPQIIEVSPEELPVQVHFRTASSRVNVQQSHQAGAPAQVEHASFQDEPHRVIHEVVKPVIQEVREIIQPYRRVTQEIRPVIEEVHTVVHKGEGRRPQAPLPVRAQPQYGAPVATSGGYNKAAKAAKAAKA